MPPGMIRYGDGNLLRAYTYPLSLQIAFIGHSQGNGIAFLSLSEGMRPEIGAKLSCFIALAPAVFAGPLTHGFPFTTLSRIEWSTWRVLFGEHFNMYLSFAQACPKGTLDFIPIMRHAYNWCPAKPFALIGYAMFAFLFSWTDANW